MRFIMNVEDGFIEYLNSDYSIDSYVIERGKITSSTCKNIIDRTHGNNVVYFLFDGKEPRVASKQRKIYIGETTDLYTRMIGHNREKPWWTHVIAFTGDNRKINEMCVMALERLLIEQFRNDSNYV